MEEIVLDRFLRDNSRRSAWAFYGHQLAYQVRLLPGGFVCRHQMLQAFLYLGTADFLYRFCNNRLFCYGSGDRDRGLHAG